MSWNIVEYVEYDHVRGCLEVPLNVMEYRGIAFNIIISLGSQPRPKPAVTIPQAKRQSMPYLDVALKGMKYYGISWDIVEPRGISCNHRLPWKVAARARVSWNIEEYGGIAWNIM